MLLPQAIPAHHAHSPWGHQRGLSSERRRSLCVPVRAHAHDISSQADVEITFYAGMLRLSAAANDGRLITGTVVHEARDEVTRAYNGRGDTGYFELRMRSTAARSTEAHDDAEMHPQEEHARGAA